MGIKGNDFSDMIDEVFEKEGLPRSPGGVTNNLRVSKEAARAGVGLTVLPGFTVRNEVQSNTLSARDRRGSLAELSADDCRGASPLSECKCRTGKESSRRKVGGRESSLS
jgi:hypothetical protein